VQVDEIEERVYNFKVAELENYAVGDCGVLVHNRNEGKAVNGAGKGAKSLEQYNKHVEKLQEAKQKLQALKDKLAKTKGPKAQGPIKDEIAQLEKSIKGHEKEIQQKWPNFEPPH
jgi:hypothetical protein